MHHRPLRRRDAPPPLRLLLRQLHHVRHPQVRLDPPILHIHPAPNHLARLTHALHRTATQREVHRRLPFTHRPCVPANKMLRRRGARYLEHPHELPVVILAIPQIMQRILRIQSHRRPHAIRDQSIDARALIHFIEMRQRTTRVQLLARHRAKHRRPIHVIQQPLGQIRSRADILQPLLVLDPDRIAPEVIRDPHRRNIHPALLQ